MRIHSVFQAAQCLVEGQVVALPTETVYGLAADGYNAAAMEKIYIFKGRPKNNPLILHYRDIGHVQQDVVWTPWANILADAFWPGPLTLVLSRCPHGRVPDVATAGQETVAVRVPAHPLFQKVLHLMQGPLAAPSANPSGELSPTRPEHVERWFSGFVLDGGACAHGLESTILDARKENIELLRHGAISQEAIKNVLLTHGKGHLTLKEAYMPHKDKNASLMPGQLEGHYAPKKPLRLNAKTLFEGEGLLAFGRPLPGADICIQLSENEDLVEAARHLFHGLYLLDNDVRCQSIAVMPFPLEGLGLAIMDRLTRASIGSARRAVD